MKCAPDVKVYNSPTATRPSDRHRKTPRPDNLERNLERLPAPPPSESG
jgi:hypothetical protein